MKKLLFFLNYVIRVLTSMQLRGVAQPGSALVLGARCRRFESSHPDHLNKNKKFTMILI